MKAMMTIASIYSAGVHAPEPQSGATIFTAYLGIDGRSWQAAQRTGSGFCRSPTDYLVADCETVSVAKLGQG